MYAAPPDELVPIYYITVIKSVKKSDNKKKKEKKENSVSPFICCLDEIRFRCLDPI